MAQTIMVVEDEASMRGMIVDYLTAIGYQVFGVADGLAAVQQASQLKPELILLDIMLPGMDGYEVVRKIRRDSAVPIIMLTARAEEADKLIGLELGADDYLTKPFSIRELAARIRAVFRRMGMVSATTGQAGFLRYGPFQLDQAKRQLILHGLPVGLTAVQFDIVARMLRQPGRVFTRAELLDTVAEGINSEAYERTIDAHIKNIRKAIEPDPVAPRYILTLRNAGYKFAELSAAELSAQEAEHGI